MSKARVATVWMDGCSGCHMSFLDMDERLLALADKIELVYSPLVDIKQFPEGVDVTIVEGAVSTEDDLKKAKVIRARTKILVALGDCAVTSNVPGMRNQFGREAVLARAYLENADINQKVPDRVIPALLPHSRPLHEFVSVDVFLPGCPPSADLIHHAVSELLAGRKPDLDSLAHFG
ncbi:MAG: NADP oxidoreductase [Elusimicrobia bacterium]|nr:NADP oxidoreductase [Elusimicrobiota bacterium]